MLASLFALGLLLGLRHALEADHVAAVAALATRARSLGERAKLAGAWGAGHAATLLAVGAALAFGGLSLSEGASRAAEAAAGGLVVLLGADVLRRLWRERVHVHPHVHADGTVHVHAHAHAPGTHARDAHEHVHPARGLPRAWLVGTLHGLGGSAALVLLSTQAAGSPGRALAYLALVALGAAIGMVALTLAISLPLRRRWARGARRPLELAVGLASVALGVRMLLSALS